jgi:hypothetical protein
MPIEGMATKFDLKDGQYGPYALGTVKDSAGEEAKVLFSSKDNAPDPKDNKPLPDSGCLNRPAVWVGLYDANKNQYRVLFNYYTGTSTAPQNPPQTPNMPARDTGVSIERQCVVKAVCEIVARRGGQMDKAEALDWCHHLHHWIQTGRSPAETLVGAQGDQEPGF